MPKDKSIGTLKPTLPLPRFRELVPVLPTVFPQKKVLSSYTLFNSCSQSALQRTNWLTLPLWYRANCHIPVQKVVKRQQGCTAIQGRKQRQRHFQTSDIKRPVLPAGCCQHLTIAGEVQVQSTYLGNTGSTTYKLRKGNCSSSVQRIPKVLCNHKCYFIHPQNAVPSLGRTGFGHSVGLSITLLYLATKLTGWEVHNISSSLALLQGTGLQCLTRITWKQFSVR